MGCWVGRGLREGLQKVRREFGGGGAGFVHYSDCGDVLQVYTYVKMFETVHFKYV